MSEFILALDAGTTGVTALLIDRDRHVVSRGYQDFPQHFPHPGWVEHEPEEIWTALLIAVTRAVGVLGSQIVGVGVTNQRETLVIWDRETLKSVRPAIVWQDRRTSEICERLKDVDVSRAGLRVDPYFTATKIMWVRENEPEVWAGIESGQYAIGTVDSYLVARLSAGKRHITDATNASRTLLYNLERGEWDQELLDLFGVPRIALAEITSSYGELAHCEPSAFLGISAPITGIAGDQQAALVGQAGVEIGAAACAYGTGSFVLVNTGTKIPSTSGGLLATVAIAHPDGGRSFASEGAVFVTGAAVQWFRDGLGAIESSAEIEELAGSVPESAGVVFVPALTGLGAPYWDSSARGAILGITRGTTKAHIARALLESIAWQVAEMVEMMESQSAIRLPFLAAHGGASSNTLLCQMQASALQRPVRRRRDPESTALGAAELAALGLGWAATVARQDVEEIADGVDIVDRVRWQRAIRAVRLFGE
ncbi:glycerol kinase [mine drainage metagenome]|uniref:ATP:glycerol 3-phosphotransferase n=1 Tax=mine drainage metagenome TaxID=410659 RepID=A0A1J5R2E8_9ZZZZ